MINGYEIKKVYNEEILYVHLEFNQEFASIKGKKKKEKLNNIIIDYVKNNNITFKGKTIAIVVSGIVIGTLMLKSPINTDPVNSLNNYTTAVIKNDEIVPQALDNITPKDNKPKLEKLANQEESRTKSTTKTSSSNVPSKVKNAKSSLSKVATTKKVSTTTREEQDNNKTYIIIKRSSGVLTSIELEEYLIGVVGAEMPASFNSEALKAQAIIARTYAINVLNKGKILTDTSSTQNYKDNNELKKMWGSDYNKYFTKIKKAVDDTKGIYLTYNGEIIDAVYHSTSNGKTEDAIYVWGNFKPYLVSVDSPYDTTNKSFIYEKFIAYQELTQKFNMEINQNTKISILSRTSGNRIDKIQINDKTYTGVEIRTLLGLRSADFEIYKEENGISFKTKGYGHGVGLSQYGANGMANNGYNYEQILKHYYKGVKLTKI